MGIVFYPDILSNNRTVQFISGHLATLIVIAGFDLFIYCLIVVLFVSSDVHQCKNTTSTNITASVGDSEGDEYDAERSPGDSDTSDDSDLELVSPRYIQQTGI